MSIRITVLNLRIFRQTFFSSLWKSYLVLRENRLLANFGSPAHLAETLPEIESVKMDSEHAKFCDISKKNGQIVHFGSILVGLLFAD